jgi:hypothetical protein
MTHPGLSTSDMSSANYGIPTPPANDNSDAKNPFFPSSDVKEGEKKKDLVETTVIHDSTDASSEHSMPSTPEPSNQSQSIQSQSKVRFYITDPSMVPILVARIAETNNVKLPDTSSTPLHSGNYGDLSVSTAPSVCESVSSIPDLSDSASSPVSSPHEEDSSNDSSGTSSTDQSRSVTSNVMSAVPCATSTTTPTVVTSSTVPISDISNTTTTTTNASYSVRVLQKIANSSTDASSPSSSSSSVDNSKTTTSSDQVTNNDENVTSTSKVTIANAIVTASAAPRTVVYHDRSARRSKRKGIPYKSPSHDDLLREPGFVFSFPVLFNNVLPTKHSVSDKNNQDENAKETSSCEMEQGTSTTSTNNANDTNNVTNTSSESHSTKNKDTSINNESQSAKIIHRPLLLPDIVRSLNQARRSKMRTRPVTRAKNRRENEELDMFNLGIEHMIDSQNSNAAAIEEAKARKRRIATVGRPSKKSILPSSSSQVPRSSNSGENKSPRGSSICSTSSSSSAAAFYRIPSKRRDSMSVSSLSSIPPSELSDFDLNSDNFGDDEDDPDFAPPAKKRKSEVQRGSKTVGRKESNSKVKVCASCRTKSTPCWRPGWSTDLMLCNSCGLRFVIFFFLSCLLLKFV